MAEAEAKYPAGWIVVDHIIPGCTEEMLDWWWVNMEKGYELWCPDEHKGFKWEVPPPLGGHIGAVQIAKESIDYGPVMDLRIEWVDPNIGTPEQKDFWTYSHLLAAGRPAAGSASTTTTSRCPDRDSSICSASGSCRPTGIASG